MILKSGEHYTEAQLDKATCPDCGKSLELEYNTKPNNDMISASCCTNLYGIYPEIYKVYHDKI